MFSKLQPKRPKASNGQPKTAPSGADHTQIRYDSTIDGDDASKTTAHVGDESCSKVDGQDHKIYQETKLGAAAS
jgi:hypothetical protein